MGHHISVSGRSGGGGGEVVSVTGTANQVTASPTTGDVILTIPATFIAPGSIASTTTIQAGTTFNGLNGQTITGNSSGAWTIAANGTNQSITLTPSGMGAVIVANGTVVTPGFVFATASQTGGYQFGSGGFGIAINGAAGLVVAPTTKNTLLGGLTTDGTGVLQFPAATTTAGGIGFSTDTFFSRISPGRIGITATGAVAGLDIYEGATITSSFRSTSGAVTLITQGATTLTLGSNAAADIVIDASHNTTLAGKITSYKGVTTAGWGVPAIQAEARLTGRTAAVASVATYTVGAADGLFSVAANVNVTISSAEAFAPQCTYTDETNVSRTVVLPLVVLAGTVATSVAFANGAVPYAGLPIYIRCKASTAITVLTSAGGTYTGCTFNVEGYISQGS